MTPPLVEIATAARARDPGSRLGLAALLWASLVTAQETTPPVAVAPASSATTSTTPAAPPTTPAAPAAATAAPATSDDSGWLAWTAIGAGSALLAVSAWQWIVFADDNSEAGDLCPARSRGLARCADAEAQRRYLSARDDAKNARVLAVILGGLGAASLVTGILLFPDSDPASASARVTFSADPFARDARASLSWAW